ncbi:hypothetical protein PAXRUDRAFT_19942 [Paxillus rubicundulus Ve08.2h10]|uniref:DDE-1 domain-containing protein n=1 Tax=Paxillus rubicundulus Ve08.2h10 TaxID=930991 RepID=A0A0D0CTN6_9AGAM|nr:hypothetical protein PAXRUDRAFT_19942 [Paxillus rubicundulus Ve08.2h10]
MINALQKQQPKLFSHLHKGTISKWIDKTKQRQWSVVTLINIQNGHTLAGSGQSGILCHYPQVKEEIVEKLKSLRTSGVPINVIVARSIMLAVIQNRAPDLLATFKCSEKFVQSFFDSILNWSPRKGTRTAAKLPANADDKCTEAFFRLVYIMKWHSVPPKLVVGFDQIGSYILPSSGTTFAEHGSRQVDIVAKDEKQAFTLLVASTPDEQKKGSHFSMLKTMKEWVEHIFEPYRCQVIKSNPDLSNDQYAIIYLDCYPVHTSQEFHSYIIQDFPYIILCFIPAGCTGIFQPADTQYLVDLHQEALKSGLTADQVKFTTSLPVLRDASVAGILSVYEFMTGPFRRGLVQKSWAHCRVEGWDLSAECLTSRRAQTALIDYLRTHSTLHKEIEDQMGVVYGLNDSESDYVTADADDDADVPLSAVIRDALGVAQIPAEVDSVPLCVGSTEKGPHISLVAAGEYEDIWAFINFDAYL